MKNIARKLHRYLSYLVFLQVTLWILGGTVFAVIPFDSVVKGGAVVTAPESPQLPRDWQQLIEPHRAAVSAMTGLAAHASAQGPLLELQGPAESRWVRAVDGQLAAPLTEDQLRQFAVQLYRGEGAPTGVRYMEESERRVLGLVDELYGRTGVWQVSFDDALETRLYFEGDTGRYLTVRNDAWVLFDAMWRLHVMDYREGADFNNVLLIVFSLLSLGFCITGVILTWYAFKNVLRERAV